MTAIEKTLSPTLTSGLDEWQKMNGQFLHNWHTSVDKTFDSLSQFFNFTNSTFDSLSKYQNDNLNLYFNGAELAADEVSKAGSKANTEKRKSTRSGLAIVTGGIGGIGTAICQKLAEDNEKIIATYIQAETEYALEWQQERQKEGLDIELYECDVSDFSSCKKAAGNIQKAHGPIDVLVNCAGITRDAMLKKLDEESWHAVLDTNLDSVFNMTRNFVDGMLKQGYGRIINISSVNGQKGQFGQTNYSSAKAGLIGFSRSLAIELADKGITVNCVCPGYVSTRMVEAIPEHVKEAIIAQIPAGRLAKPAEIASAVAYLASEDSGYVTGTELAVNGGLWTG
jgi:acetoacetyl-CoA reductase